MDADAIQNPVGLRRSLVLETPGDGDGSVDDDAAHLRPSSRRAFHETPPSVVPLRSAFSFAAVSLFCALTACASPTRRATALPWRVMTTSSPASTRSSRAERWVLAS